MDATRLRMPGGTGDDWREHLAYDLIAARVAQVHVTDNHTAEVLEHFDLKPGDIAVVDGRYGYRRSVAYAESWGADVVLRMHPATFPLEDADGHPFDVMALLRQRKGAPVQEHTLFCWYDGERYTVRMVMAKLPPAEARAARRRKQQAAKKRGKPVTLDQLYIAGWVLLITTLDADTWSATDVLRLYRARWQVELVFKRMKQILALNTIRCRSLLRVEATVRAFLVAWLLHEREASWVRRALERVQKAVTDTSSLTTEDGFITSSWLVTTLCLESLRNQVRGQWTQQRIKECLPDLQRFLCHRKRQDRKHQETDIRDWLEGRGVNSRIAHQKEA